MSAREMAEIVGLPPKLTYTIAETAKYTGFTPTVLSDAIRSGELRGRIPRGNVRGRRIKPEDVDAWMETL